MATNNIHKDCNNMAREKVCGIYKIVNKINGKFYIGSSNDIYGRFTRHKYQLNNNKHTNEHLQAAWNAYGAHNFELQIVEMVDLQNLLIRETYYIQYYKCTDRTVGYNKSTDAVRQTMSEEGKERVRQWHKNKIVKHSTRQKLSKINKGINKWTQEQREQMSKQRKGTNVGKDNPMYGKTKELNPMYGKQLSQQAKQKISNGKKGITKQQNAKLSSVPKRCICLETGKTYNSLVEASRDTGVQTKAISYCVNGIRDIASGLHFQLYKEE